IIKILEGIRGELDEVVGASKKLIRGLCHNNSFEYDKALPLFEDSLQIFERYPLPHFQFLALFNLVIVNYNLFNPERIKYYLDKLREIPDKNTQQELRFQSTRLIYALATE